MKCICFLNLSKVVDLSTSDRSFFVKLRLSQEDVQKLTADAQARFQEYLQTVAPEIREFASDDQLLKAWQKKHLCAMVKDFVSLPKTPLFKEAAINASFSPEKVSRKFDMTMNLQLNESVLYISKKDLAG